MAYDYYADPRFSGMAGATMPQDMSYMNAFRPYQPMEYQPQQQFQQMNQQAPQAQIQAPQTQNMNQPSNFTRTQQNVFVRAVTGREEAIAAQIPLDGSIVAFTDFAHKKIYTKQLNMNDGSAIFDTYEKVEMGSKQEEPKTEPEFSSIDPSEYVKRTEIDSLRAQFEKAIAEMSEKLKQINIQEGEPQAVQSSAKSGTRGGNK